MKCRICSYFEFCANQIDVITSKGIEIACDSYTELCDWQEEEVEVEIIKNGF